MKIERNLMKMSLLDTLLYFVLLFVFINGIIFLFTIIITGEPKIFISDGSWISQLLFPFLYSVIHNSINTYGVVKITVYSDFDYLREQI